MDDYNWFCPLLDEVIEDGDCTDINFQRLGIFPEDFVLLEAKEKTSKTTAEISQVCEKCPNRFKVLYYDESEKASLRV
ncbi:hypothetical protein LQF76_11270 [Gloeomargaritales cyanobacterium VI4D9]|nr:hypothetical protein LQF76_11270 [Gloeomargaritales cyanobacterium VI4D9]